MNWAIIWDWLRRRPPSRCDHVHFQVYTRRGCHLCEDVWSVLEQERRKYGFGLEAVDVDADAELAALYGEQVPVVAVDGKVRFRGRLNRVLLRRLLEAVARRGEYVTGSAPAP